MPIHNTDELLQEISKILPSIKCKRQDADPAQASLFESIHTKITKIQTKVSEGDFDVKSKKECNMDGEIANLETRASNLIEPLSEINTYFQAAHITTLDDAEAAKFLSMRR